MAGLTWACEGENALAKVDVSARFYCRAKRLLDVIISAAVLALLLIPMAVIGAAVYFDDHGTVFFTQNRVGMHGKLFRIYKFRTMTEGAQQNVTRVGRILRRLSLDELPQLYNIIRGDMSLIGPRPLIPEEGRIHTLRLRSGVYGIRPGLTGLAQINGRDLISPQEKLVWDVRYLRHFGLRQDLRILLATLPKILVRGDAKP